MTLKKTFVTSLVLSVTLVIVSIPLYYTVILSAWGEAEKRTDLTNQSSDTTNLMKNVVYPIAILLFVSFVTFVISSILMIKRRVASPINKTQTSNIKRNS